MIPMKINPELYAKYFAPGPDYLVIERVKVNIDRIGRIAIPDAIKEHYIRFIGVGKVLAVSEMVSESEHNEYLKKYAKDCGYVGFSHHVAAQCPLMPQFEFERDETVVMLHIKDVVQYISNYNELMTIYEEWLAQQNKEEIRFKQELLDQPSLIEQERSKLILGE